MLDHEEWEKRLTALLTERGPEPMAMDVLAPVAGRAWATGLMHGLVLLAGLGALATAMFAAWRAAGG